MSLVPKPPSIPRTALRSEERSDAYAVGRELLRRAAVATYRGSAYAPGAAGPSEADKRIVLEQLRLDAQIATRSLTARLLAGSLSREAWQRGMRQSLVGRHYAAALAVTGSTVLDSRTRQNVDALVRRQLGFLARFRTDLAVGGTPLDGRALVRADLYGAAVWATGQQVLRMQAEEQEYTEERAIRHARDSCATCIDRAAQGWQPIGTLVPIGDGICRTRCQCSWEFR